MKVTRFLCVFILFVIIISPDISISTYILTREFCSHDYNAAHLTYICAVENEQNLFECNLTNLEEKSVVDVSFKKCHNISQLSRESFDGLKGNPELKKINLSGVGLKTLSDDVFTYFPELTTLIASENELNNIRCSNDKLEYLDLSFNQFTEVESIKFRQLKTLILSNNKITRIANNAFSNIENLKKLDLTFNELNEFSVKIVSSSNLEELIVHHNKLRNLADDIFSKSNLHYLDLSYNQFTDIESLKRTGAHELTTLDLTHNQITNISDTAFVYFTKLKVLDLSFNNLTSLVDGTFDEQRLLQNLSITNNKLLHMDFGILSALWDLESLDLTKNHIKDINTIGEHLAIFSHLRRINMSNNEIIKINGLTNSTFPALNYLNLRDNQLGCSHLKHILRPFDLHKLRLDVDPRSKIKKGNSYRGVVCQNDSNSFVDDTGGE